MAADISSDRARLFLGVTWNCVVCVGVECVRGRVGNFVENRFGTGVGTATRAPAVFPVDGCGIGGPLAQFLPTSQSRRQCAQQALATWCGAHWRLD